MMNSDDEGEDMHVHRSRAVDSHHNQFNYLLVLNTVRPAILTVTELAIARPKGGRSQPVRYIFADVDDFRW
jgi:hypothetical protein